MNESESIRSILEKLGFDLRDKGSYWQTKAIWRQGDNPTAIQIYKDSGVWNDYVAGTTGRPFKSLIKLVNGGCFDDVTLSFLDQREEDFLFEEKKEILKMSQKYSTKILKRLLPQHNFYLDKGISESTLHKYRSGYATSEKMAKRYVFPIFDTEDKDYIVGFTGRSIYWDKNSTIPKWKHIGRKSEWIYPLYTPYNNELPFLDSVLDTRTIYIVESVGDSLALSERGYMNNMVSFGLTLSSNQISKLIELDVNKIIISPNNDSSKLDNPGYNSGLKNYLKLLSFFDIKNLEFKPCPENQDLSDLHLNRDKDKFKNWINSEFDSKKCCEEIHDKLTRNDSFKLIGNKKERESKYKLISGYLGEEEWN